MFTIANRLRGTWSWFAKVNAVALAILITLLLPDTHMMQFSIEGWFSFSIANDLFYGLATCVMYVAGESMGWGKWIGGVFNQYEYPATSYMVSDTEGRSNGIHYLASLIMPETENYYVYSFVALTIRGFYWFAITLLPLVLGGHISLTTYISAATLLGVGFPLSVKLGAWTADRFRIKFMDGYWEHAEVWYGLMQDVVLGLMLLTLIGLS